MKLIDDIKHFGKFLSVQASLLGAAITTYAFSDPAGAAQVIGSIVPPAAMPYVGIAVWLIGSLAGRAVKQPSLQPPVPRVGDTEDGHK